MHPSVHCSIIFSGQGMETTSASTDEWIKKCDTQITHTHRIEYYSAIKKNESLPFVDRAWGHYAKWSIRQRKTATVWFHLYVASENKPKHNKLKKKKKELRYKDRLVVSRDEGQGMGVKVSKHADF